MVKADLVIRGGTIVDGQGGDPFEADIAIVDGRIARIGVDVERGREEIDARDLLVTPGFVDVHTHYDGQVTWTDSLVPSTDHGVTTVVIGNCGVGFAPCRPKDREALVNVMEGVEDIPEAVMAKGLPCWGGRLPTASQCARVSALQDSIKGAARGANYPHRHGYVKERFSTAWRRCSGEASAAQEVDAPRDDSVFRKAATHPRRYRGMRQFTSLGSSSRIARA